MMHMLPEIITLLDTNGDGDLDSNELVLDSDEKVAFIAEQLTERGLENNAAHFCRITILCGASQRHTWRLGN